MVGCDLLAAMDKKDAMSHRISRFSGSWAVLYADLSLEAGVS